MGSKVFNSFYSFLYILYPLIIIYLLFIDKDTNIYDNIYNQLILNNAKNYLRDELYGTDGLIPTNFPTEFLNKDTNEIITSQIINQCPMTVDDVKNIQLSSSNEKNINNNNENIRKIKLKQLENQKKQEKLNQFILNIDKLQCACLPISERIFTTIYLCKSIGLSSLFELNEKSKTNGVISQIYEKIPEIDLDKNSNNLFLGQVSYDASKSFVLILFNLMKGLSIFNIIKLWVNTLTFYNLYSIISGYDIKVRKNKGNKVVKKKGKKGIKKVFKKVFKNEKEVYYDGSKNIMIKTRLIFYALIISFFYLLPPILIQLPFFFYKKRLSRLKSVLKPDSMLIGIIYLIVYLIFSNLIRGIFNGTNSFILNTAKDGFNKKDHPLLNDLSYSFSLFHDVKKINFIYIVLQLIIFITLIYSIYTAFTNNINILFILPLIIIVSTFISIFQFNNEGNFKDIFRKCGTNNANPYAYTNKLRNLPFWNITSAYVKYNYKNF